MLRSVFSITWFLPLLFLPLPPLLPPPVVFLSCGEQPRLCCLLSLHSIVLASVALWWTDPMIALRIVLSGLKVKLIWFFSLSLWFNAQVALTLYRSVNTAGAIDQIWTQAVCSRGERLEFVGCRSFFSFWLLRLCNLFSSMKNVFILFFIGWKRRVKYTLRESI